MKWHVYWRLARFDKPVGILLLWFPTAWALWIANQGTPPFKLLMLFLTGTVLMRSAGCVINDIADRHIDMHVARTQQRPLAAGEVSLIQAFIWLLVLLSGAFLVLIQLPKACFLWAFFAVLITFIYPFCKRFINAPQMVLGMAFSMGIPMAYLASEIPFDWQCIVLIVLNWVWILVYDTVYALSDKADDLRIGVKSTAIYFGSHVNVIIGLLQVILQGLWLYWAIKSHAGVLFYWLWFISGLVLVVQHRLIDKGIPRDCFRAFLISCVYGGLMWIAVILQ